MAHSLFENHRLHLKDSDMTVVYLWPNRQLLKKSDRTVVIHVPTRFT